MVSVRSRRHYRALVWKTWLVLQRHLGLTLTGFLLPVRIPLSTIVWALWPRAARPW